MIGQKAWQGSFDGFCGIYSAVHALCHDSENYETVSGTAFFSILRALEDAQKLTARKISGPNCGFYDLEIASAINAISARSRRSKLAVAFRDARFLGSALQGKADEIFNHNGSLIIQENGPKHWIAALGRKRDGNYECLDPAVKNPRLTRQRISWDQGVLIGPQQWISSI